MNRGGESRGTNGQSPYDGEDGLDEEIDDSSSSSDEEEGFLIKIDTLMGTNFHLLAYPTDTVELLKTRIAFQEGIPQKDQTLLLPTGKRPLGNSTLLSELGLGLIPGSGNDDEPCSTLRLVTNISSGLPRAVVTSSGLSPPSTALPFLPSCFPLGRRGSNNNNNSDPPQSQSSRNQMRGQTQGQSGGQGHLHHSFLQEQDSLSSLEDLKLPRLSELNEKRIDGVIVLRDRNDQRVFLIIKRSANGNSDGIEEFRTRRGLLTNFNINSRNNTSGGGGGGESNSRSGTARKKEFSQLERIRENAKTLQKMNRIRQKLTHNRKGTSTKDPNGNEGQGHDDKDESLLPNINLNQAKVKEKLLSRPETSSEGGRASTAIESGRLTSRGRREFNRGTLTSSMANLNRLKAEIYLEAKRVQSAGGSGQTPYTSLQLSKYVQLKVKILVDSDCAEKEDDFSTRFMRSTMRNTHSLTPTVVLNRKLQAHSENSAREKGGGHTFAQIDNNSARRTARQNIKSGRRGEFKENNPNDRNIHSASNSEKSAKRALPKASVITNFMASSRPPSASLAGGIQKKKKTYGVTGAAVRCDECRKRIGLACRYQCRCGGLFCPTHRYAETHRCSFDYKAEGKKLLRQSNPLVTPSKVPEI